MGLRQPRDPILLTRADWTTGGRSPDSSQTKRCSPPGVWNQTADRHLTLFLSGSLSLDVLL